MDIKIYSKTDCGYCDQAKLRLQKYNPKVLMLDQDYSRDDFFQIFPNAKTFPQIIINSKHVGGYHDLEKWLAFNSPDENF